MARIRLHSDKIDKYDSLGERGLPVYQVASQILSTLQRHRPDLAQHFAIPQASDDGSLIDWYTDDAGLVIPWSAASEEEKASLIAQLTKAHQEIDTLQSSLATSSSDGGSLFIRLLPCIRHYPDSSHIFMVDGRPVVTFWGFLKAGADRSLAPLHALATTPSVTVAAAVPAESPTASPAVATLAAGTTAQVIDTGPAEPWWRRWWLWLLLLLLLALLLFGLRACSPTAGFPWLNLGLPSASLPASPVGQLPSAVLPTTPGTAIQGTSASLPGGNLAMPEASGPDIDASLGAAELPNMAALPDAAGVENAAQAPPAADLPAPSSAPASQHIDEAGSAEGPPPPYVPASMPESAQGAPLAFPTQLSPNGTPTFLNGNWRVRAGIQDRNTGAPLHLHYQFQDGQGHVTLDRHNGVQCQAPVSALLNGGTLDINSSAIASCTDGGTYEMPAIRCQPDETNSAACQGSYGNERFPLTMRQAEP